jgi:putative lipoprotein (rSAM/lipoprotein system)
VVEYGTPTAVFKVTGKVISATGESLSAIKVVMSTDSTRTSPTGEFDVKVEDFPMNQEYHVKFIDDDGTQSGGEFITLDTLVKFTDPKFEDGDGDWFSGTASKTLNVKLEKKN